MLCLDTFSPFELVLDFSELISFFLHLVHGSIGPGLKWVLGVLTNLHMDLLVSAYC